jgi:glycosyltransferase involved in cell wall biosynthesis
MRIAALARYGALGASSRVRMYQYGDALRRAGIALEADALLDDAYLSAKYAGGRTPWTRVLAAYLRRALAMSALARRNEMLWVEKELWPWAPAWLERLAWRGRPVALDFDDAIFHNYDLHRARLVRVLYGRKIDRLMRAARIVLAGNDYLAARAREAGARSVLVLPTVVDLARYAPKARPAAQSPDTPVRIAWIGTPATVHYLRGLAAPLAEVAKRHAIEVRVIGAELELPGVPVRHVPWSDAGEAAAIAECDIGVMPLPDSPWERGKCGYKLIQYMACGLPVVASPVGVNCRIVRPGANGFLAADDASWATALGELVADAALRARLGAAGRALVESDYSLQANAPRLAAALRETAGTDPSTEE